MTDQSVTRNEDASERSDASGAQRKRPLTPTERSRNSRARKRAEAGMARRRPLYGPDAVDPLADAMVQELLDSGDCPEELLQPRFRWSVEAWGRDEAILRLHTAYVASLPGITEALTAVSTSEETSDSKGGHTTRRVITRTQADALSALDRIARRAAASRNDIGLSPASAARMGRDVAPKYDSALIVAGLIEADNRKASDGQQAEDPAGRGRHGGAAPDGSG